MTKLKIKTYDQTYELNIQEAVMIRNLVEKIQKNCRYPLVAAMEGYQFLLMEDQISGGSIELLDMRSSIGNRMVQRSLAFLYRYAVHEVLGYETKVVIANAISKGVFTKVKSNQINKETIIKIEKKMKDCHLPIFQRRLRRNELIQWAREYELKESLVLLESNPILEMGYACEIGREKHVFFEPLVVHTSLLPIFACRLYRSGILLRYPTPDEPDVLPAFEEEPTLYEAFSQETQWEKLLGAQCSYDLNDKFRKGEGKDLILLSEALHEMRIAEIAKKIQSQHKQLILIAGPSSSGKTSFAKRLILQLKVLGLKPLYLGTDDYFVDRLELKPRADGKVDFESLDAVDLTLFNQQMNDLLAGKRVDIPHFDFIQGKKVFGQRFEQLAMNRPIVIEGIHGLNPILSEQVADEVKFKIYISPLTQLNIDTLQRIPTTDVRLLRRILRDHRTRGYSARKTLLCWPNVRHGEDVNIFPYNSCADAFFNTQAIYELSLLKPLVEPLLEEILLDEQVGKEAKRLLNLLMYFVSVSQEEWIPNNAIMREFIGGSILF